jgi:ERCC4-type nuclease
VTITSAIIDTREPDHIKTLTFGGVPTIPMALDAGDVLAATDDACQVLIERKTPSDLLGTLGSKRLFPQMTKMLEITPWAYLVITGLLYRDRDGMVTVGGQGHTGWRYADVQGALLTCQEMGIGVLTCGSDDEFEQTVIRICNRDRGTVRIKPPRESYLLKDGEAALAALPGIGPERVQALAKLGRLAMVFEWLTDLESTTKIPGVADGTKQAVKRALGLEGEMLKIIPQTARESSYMPNGGFIAAADQAAMDYLNQKIEEVTSNGE